MAMICLVGTKLNHSLLPVAFAFSAGTFLYVSLTHIVPEIGSNLKAWHLLAMLAGLLFPYFCFIEAEFPFCFEQTRRQWTQHSPSMCKCHRSSSILLQIWEREKNRFSKLQTSREFLHSLSCHLFFSSSFIHPFIHSSIHPSHTSEKNENSLTCLVRSARSLGCQSILFFRYV